MDADVTEYAFIKAAVLYIGITRAIIITSLILLLRWALSSGAWSR